MFEIRKPLVSIIIPSWFIKGQDGKYGKNETFWFAQECLKKLIERTPRELYELILIDNGSNLYIDPNFEADYSFDGMGTEPYWNKADILIKNKENLGFGPACNQGFAVARGEYIVCLNNDVIVFDGWLDSLLEVFVHSNLNPRPGVVMPALARETRDAREALKLTEVDLSANYDKLGVGAEFGSLWIAPKKLLKKIANNRDGYQIFDENFKMGMGEDRLLWEEVRKEGYETYRTHRTRVFHQGNMTICKIPNRKEITSKNREYLERMREKIKKENKI